ncbi:MAG: MBL fold metallo-hydrolase [Peptococcaceae bacterium]|nr:MBL fold metallo-hydrolase [Peptococcaceae bacterium]
MIIKTLVENTAISDDFEVEHGLSLYIQTKMHKMLFDLGASTLFIRNAERMGVDLSDIDLVVISHGHYDHGGGLKAFLNHNTKAKVLLNKRAFQKHYAVHNNGQKANIGLDQDVMTNNRLVFVEDDVVIDKELELFSNVKGEELISKGNNNLMMELSTGLVKDDFAHEQNLIIKEEGKTLLVAGCAHKGIVNILEHLRDHKNLALSHVIGGFHLYSRSSGQSEDPVLGRQIGEYLKTTGLTCYTCHCTGTESYRKLKEIMGEQIHYLAAGSQLTI